MGRVLLVVVEDNILVSYSYFQQVQELQLN